MLHKKLLISKLSSVDKPLDINVSESLDETQSWISIHNLPKYIKEEINILFVESFDAVVDEYLKFKESLFNTRTGYGKSSKGKNPRTSAGEKASLLNELKKLKNEITSKRLQATDAMSMILYDINNNVGKDTINDLIIFLIRDGLSQYNAKIYNELVANPSLALVKIELVPINYEGLDGLFRGLSFDGSSPIFLLPETIMRVGVPDIKGISKLAPALRILDIINCYETLRVATKKLGVNERNITSIIKLLVKNRPSSIESLKTKSENSQRNKLLSNKDVESALLEILSKI